MFFKKNTGFSLIELMVTVIIIGTLSAIALPAYKRYQISARTAEGYIGLDFLSKREVTYFYENHEFHYLGSSNPSIITEPMFMETGNVDWKGFHPFPPGNRTDFSYIARAGKSDASGTELTSTPLNSLLRTVNELDMHIRRSQINPAGILLCNPQTTPADAFGAVNGPNHDWVIVSAVGNLNTADYNLCTAIVRLIESSPGNRNIPTPKTSYATYNLGE